MPVDGWIEELAAQAALGTQASRVVQVLAAKPRFSSYASARKIADSAGVPIVVISNDGAAAVTQRIAMSKIQAVLKYKMSSGDVAKKAAADPAFAAELKANPLIDTARQGALARGGWGA